MNEATEGGSETLLVAGVQWLIAKASQCSGQVIPHKLLEDLPLPLPVVVPVQPLPKGRGLHTLAQSLLAEKVGQPECSSERRLARPRWVYQVALEVPASYDQWSSPSMYPL